MASEAKKEQTKKVRKWISQEKREVIFLFLFPRGSFFLFLFWACFAWSGREWAGVGVACVLSNKKWCEVFFLSAYRNMTSA